MRRENNIIKLDKDDVKKIQRRQYLEKKQKVTFKNYLKGIKLTKNGILTIIIIALGGLFYYLINNYHRIGLVINRNITAEDAVVIETLYTDNIVTAYKDKVLVFEKGVLTAYDTNGVQNWSKKLEEIFTPDINVAGKYIQIVNKDTGYIYVLDNQYEVCRIKIQGNILSSSINKDGTSVIEYSTSGLKTVLGVYNKNGKEKYSLKLDNNTVSSYCLSDNSRYLAYGYADISGISVVTKIDVIDMNKLGQKDYKFNTIIEKNNELVHKIYWDKNELNAMLNNTIIKYNANRDKKDWLEIGDLNAINLDINDEKIAFISAQGDKANYILSIANYKGKVKSNKVIEEAPKYFMYQDGLVFVCYQKAIKVFNTYGVNVKNYESNTTITKPIVFNDGKNVAFSVSNRITIFEI
ncbi:MAG: hypothetical protein IKV94_03785 [Clostridia bacterium]|nr:hypothetical protein [Clostridia bacterium]